MLEELSRRAVLLKKTLADPNPILFAKFMLAADLKLANNYRIENF